MECPKCGCPRSERGEECPRCGLVFRKWESDRRSVGSLRKPKPVAPRALDSPRSAGTSRKERQLLVAAIPAALSVYAVPFLRLVFSTFVTLFHELGHAAASWILGHPAVPAFDLVYGGGFIHQQDFQLPLVFLVGCGWIGLGWTFRGRSRTCIAIACGALLWLAVVSSGWRREIAIAASGHAGEIVLAGAFLFMTLANVGWRRAEMERPVGAFVAVFVQIHTMHFAWRLRNDPEFLAWYLEGKGGALMNDLETISLDLRIHTGLGPDVPAVAGWLLALSFLPLGAAVGWWCAPALSGRRTASANRLTRTAGEPG